MLRTRLKEKDLEILKTIAELRILTANQITVILDRNKQALRRKLASLEKKGFIAAQVNELGRHRGRPERLFSLSLQGLDLLKAQRILPEKTAKERVLAENISIVDHQLLTNWFWAHLIHLERIHKRICVDFLSETSPFLPQSESGHYFITDSAGKSIFTPDGVFMLTDTAENKSLLFFLEVDCSSESLASPKRHSKDIRQKIINYGTYFDGLGYKRYEEFWNRRLNGFRMLFVSNSFARLNDLCSLVRQMPPSDFVWLTNSQSMFKEGISANIWIKGGDVESHRQSILGSLSCQAPIAE